MTTATWSDPNHCPFCDSELESPGAGFVDHLDDSPGCEADFDTWQSRIAGDVPGGWSG